MSSEVVRWADQAQYEAAPIQKDERGLVSPVVKLLWATPDPLGAIAAVARQYKGEPTYSLADITDEERRRYWDESFKSHLRAPHEFVQFHFFIEGVDRSFTHQMVRQRTATFGQESLRFAVKENLASETVMPPSIAADPEGAAKLWDVTLRNIEEAYTSLVNAGIPAEEARGLLPHAVATRLHWRTNLNDLLHHAGNRLCTQAQFAWRQVMIGVMEAIKTYRPPLVDPGPLCVYFPEGLEGPQYYSVKDVKSTAWQFELLGSPTPKTFAPICYHTGKCEFRAIFDRPCSIRDRVDAFAAAGVPSSDWGRGVTDTGDDRDRPGIPGINPAEWLLDPGAARS